MIGKNIPKNLISIIKIFQEYPELFAKKMLEHNSFNEEFLDVLNNSKILLDLSVNPTKYQNQKRYFYNIDDINKFYDQFFEHSQFDTVLDETNVYNAKDEEHALIIQLENALADENYILASKINKYMKLLNIQYNTYNN